MVDISIVIVNYKSLEKVINCINSIKSANWSSLSYEVVLVDNDSRDGIEDYMSKSNRDVRFIQTGENYGMGKGYNVGMRASKGEYLLILNPDTVVEENSIELLYEKMNNNPDIGVVGPRLLFPSNQVQKSCFKFPELLTPIYRRTGIGKIMKNKVDFFLMSDYNLSNEAEADWLMGSCLLVKKRVIEEIGYFDERFFMYFEDIDLCRRYKNKNYKIIYYPKATVYHHHTRASAQSPWYLAVVSNRLARIHIQSWAKYFWKWKFN